MSSDPGTPPRPAKPLGEAGTTPSWRMADQYFRVGDVEIGTHPNNDGYVMVVTMGDPPCSRRVFFDPAGRITHVR